MSTSQRPRKHRTSAWSDRSLFTKITVLGAAALTGALLGPPAASAEESGHSSASLTMHSEPGEFIGEGRDWLYNRPFDQMFGNGGRNRVHLVVYGLDGARWTLDFAAPDGELLQVGSYPDAQEYPFMDPDRPGILVEKGFICGTITGSFDVLDIAYDENGLSRFHATFEQRCGNATAALTGEVVYTPQSPLPPLQFNVDVDRLTATNADGSFVRVTGTITCNQYVFADVSFTLTKEPTYAGGNGGVPCSPGSTIPWTLYGEAQAGGPFPPGIASVSASVSGIDGFIGSIESAQFAGRAILRRGAL